MRSPGELARWTIRRLAVLLPAVNAFGALIVYLYLSVVFPDPKAPDEWLTPGRSLLVAALYTLAATFVTAVLAWRATRELRAWLATARPPTDAERRAALRLPATLGCLAAGAWALAAPVFGALNLDESLEHALEVASTILLAGATTTAAVYLVAERVLRPGFALALSSEAPPEAGSLGIAPRLLLTWALCAGVPLFGLILVPLGREVDDPQDLVAPIVFVGVVGIVAGLFATTLAARAVAEPVRAVRRAVDEVAAGRLDAEVAVDDGSEIGRLQAGFNAMVGGLRERERLRDLFGRQVGADVARQALERGVELGGQEREVAALFVDVIGSTQLAARERPERVVELLNRFFATVVDVVERHGGFVNKFEGDAALCVFGAPVEQRDHAARALAAARELQQRLAAQREEEGGLDAAIGVSCGTAVAGHVGAESRFEYTVIGDPVNEASRLTELAKRQRGRLLASATTLRSAGEPEAARWSLDGEETLRGRSEPTRLAMPL
jgi:adenylate cyclase